MEHFKLLFFCMFLSFSCNSYNSQVEIIALPPSYEYKDSWHGDTTNYIHIDFYALKNFDAQDSLDLMKVDSFVLKNYPTLEKNNRRYSMYFFKYNSEVNENTRHRFGTDRSLEVDGEEKIVLLVYEWNREGFIGVRRYDENKERIGGYQEKRPLLEKK